MFGQEHKSTAEAQPCQTMAQLTLFAVRSGDANRDSPFLGFLAFTLPQQPKLSPHPSAISSWTHCPSTWPAGPLHLYGLMGCKSLRCTACCTKPGLSCFKPFLYWFWWASPGPPVGGGSNASSAFTLSPSPSSCSLLELGVILCRSKLILLE